MPVKIKICGITQQQDAEIAASLGVDALGFIFVKTSPRYIRPADAAKIIEKIPPFITTVGVFVDEEPANILKIAEITRISAVQLHGNESPKYCNSLPLKIIKAFSVRSDFDISVLQSYRVGGFLLDTWDEKVRGGSGKTFDWSIAARAAQEYGNIILAGGLGPTNILEALESVRPYAIDVNSGVEIRPGYKNYIKMQQVVTIVRNWEKSALS